MIFSCGETWEAKKKRLSNWHDFFALWPRTVGIKDGKYQCAWFQWIKRKGTCYFCWGDHWWEWEYRLKDIEKS